MTQELVISTSPESSSVLAKTLLGGGFWGASAPPDHITNHHWLRDVMSVSAGFRLVYAEMVAWISCHERQVLCDSEDFAVSCFNCNQVAVHIPLLDSWYCAVCIQEAEKLLRAVRYRPARYGQSDV